MRHAAAVTLLVLALAAQAATAAAGRAQLNATSFDEVVHGSGKAWLITFWKPGT